MTDLSTHQQPSAFTTPLTRSLSLSLTFLKYIFRSRRKSQIDLRYASEHLLKDIGLRRS